MNFCQESSRLDFARKLLIVSNLGHPAGRVAPRDSAPEYSRSDKRDTDTLRSI